MIPNMCRPDRSSKATRRLYVCHIQETAILRDLEYVFGRYGKVIDAFVSEGEGLRYGFVVLATIDAAESAVEDMHDCIVPELSDTHYPDPMKRRLVVEFRSETVGLYSNWTV